MSTREITRSIARKLAISKQHLTGDPPPTMPDVIRGLGCLQLDPINAVTRSHEIVLWSRLGHYDLPELDALRWEKRLLFEYWAHAASMVLTEDFPLYAPYQRDYATGNDERSTALQEWVTEHDSLRRYLLERMDTNGPQPSRAFESYYPPGVGSVGWTSGRDVTHMLDYLWNSGQIMVSGRQGNQRLWDRAARFLPDWTPREELEAEAITWRAAQKSIQTLGIATPAHIRQNFTRGRYPHLDNVLQKLETHGLIQCVHVQDEDNTPPWKAPTYIHCDDLPLLERIESGDFAPDTTLLSPFDNLIADRKRTEALWDFRYRIEIYTPKHKREYGYYVLPILHGERLIGRIDPYYEDKAGVLHVNAVYVEPDAPTDAKSVTAIRDAIHNLARWLGASDIRFGDTMPPGWEAITG